METANFLQLGAFHVLFKISNLKGILAFAVSGKIPPSNVVGGWWPFNTLNWIQWISQRKKWNSCKYVFINWYFFFRKKLSVL